MNIPDTTVMVPRKWKGYCLKIKKLENGGCTKRTVIWLGPIFLCMKTNNLYSGRQNHLKNHPIQEKNTINLNIQERLGYELSYTLNRNPFFGRTEEIKQNDIFQTGSTISFRQKFYNQDRASGMFYFGHELGYQYINNRVNVEDANDPERVVNIGSKESRYHYGILVGTRLMRYPGDAGFGMDIFAGIGIGRRVYEKGYSESSYDPYFQELNQSSTYVPIIVGITFGYLGLKRREYYP